MTVPILYAAEQESTEIADPRPLRLMVMEDGILKYKDGGEVCLPGTNYYPHAWDQYINMKEELPEMNDRKAAIRKDVAHLKSIGVQVIRVGVYDRELSDGEGNLRENEHLELMDYLIFQCREQEIYCYLTLMKYWWSPDAIQDSFSNLYEKEELLYVPDALSAQKNYVTQLLNHVNSGSGVRYAEDETICVVEILNEPWYSTYEQLYDPDEVPWWQRGPHWRRNITNLKMRFEDFCTSYALPVNEESHGRFRRDMVGNYIETMVRTIRDAGLKQPLVYNLFAIDSVGFSDIEDIIPAVADSPVDAVSIYQYLPGLNEEENDDVNTLERTKPDPVPAVLDNKALLVYEFDAIGTHELCAIYPAQARRFRQMGAQIACQFQYDTDITAEYNRDWYPHYLNWFCTPAKMASFSAAMEVFLRTPRGNPFDMPPDDQVWTIDRPLDYTAVTSSEMSVWNDSSFDAMWGCELKGLNVGWTDQFLFIAVEIDEMENASIDIWMDANKGSSSTRANEITWNKRLSFENGHPDFVLHYYEDTGNFRGFEISSNERAASFGGANYRGKLKSFRIFALELESLAFASGQKFRLAVTATGNQYSAFDAMPEQTLGPYGQSENDIIDQWVEIVCDADEDGFPDRNEHYISETDVRPAFAVSFSRNQALCSTEDTWINARPLRNWTPLIPPQNPERMISKGANPYFHYEGHGLVIMQLRPDGESMKLTITPDMEKVGPCYTGEGDVRVSKLTEREHTARLELEGWENFILIELGSGEERIIFNESFTLGPGEYYLEKIKDSLYWCLY